LRRSMALDKNGHPLIEPQANMYGHAIYAIALCEACARTRDRKLRDPAQQAVNFIVYAQDLKGGGWRYQPHQAGDTSVVVGSLQPLHCTDRQAASPAIHTGESRRIPEHRADGRRRQLHLPARRRRRRRRNARGGAAVPHTSRMEERPSRLAARHWPSERLGAVTRQHLLQLLWHATDEVCPKRSLAEVAFQHAGPASATQSNREESGGSWLFERSDFGAKEGGRLCCTALALMTLQFCE